LGSSQATSSKSEDGSPSNSSPPAFLKEPLERTQAKEVAEKVQVYQNLVSNGTLTARTTTCLTPLEK